MRSGRKKDSSYNLHILLHCIGEKNTSVGGVDLIIHKWNVKIIIDKNGGSCRAPARDYKN